MKIFGVLAAALWLIGVGAAFAQAPVEAEATIQTSLGAITIALDRANAPAAVDNFIRYAREGHFDGTAIYRVVPGFVIQMGSFDANGRPRAQHGPIPLETGNGLLNVRGAVAMARGDAPDSATADFFIDLADNPNLDPGRDAPPNTTGYAVFGHVTGGLDVVDRVAAAELGGDGPFPGKAPLTPIVVQKVTVRAAANARGK